MINKPGFSPFKELGANFPETKF